MNTKMSYFLSVLVLIITQFSFFVPPALTLPHTHSNLNINNNNNNNNVLLLPNMYEISTRPWLYSLSRKYGSPIQRLQDIPDQEFEALKAAGVDMVWMMGVWRLGEYGLHFDRTSPQLLNHYRQVLPGYTTEDIIGSPYAVVNYTCNPELGTDKDIALLRNKLHRMGLRLMLDFVPNHTAVDCSWTSSHPEYYIHAPKGSGPPYNRDHYLPSGIAYGGHVWKDTAQLNYWNRDLWSERISEMMHVASLADGIRCDMAMLLLNDQIEQSWGSNLASWGYSRPDTEFWAEAIAQVKAKYPRMVFLAEAYSGTQSRLQQLGFDFTYDKPLYDRLADGNLDHIRSYLGSERSVSYLRHSAHFVGNHDEDTAIHMFGSWQRADAAAAVSLTVPGMRFYWYRATHGYGNVLDIHLRRAAPEPIKPKVETFYRHLLNITAADVFKHGHWTYLDVTGSSESWRLMAWRWAIDNNNNNINKTEKRLCVINYSDQQGSGRVVVSNAKPVDGKDEIAVTELFSGKVYHRSAHKISTEGLFVIVPAWSAQIFEYQ